ncbi:MAG TPA: homocysteine biosynthesis protein [Dehalococcoidales bacterium]|nr:homocysteine biosynthesis protein [Dehalococcoidales bacterium]
MNRTIQEINQKIKQGTAVVVTAAEIIDIAAREGIKKAAEKVDVVTTGTFGPMCSSGAYFNIGHSKPRIKLGGGQAFLNDVPAYAAFAAVDLFLGANAVPDDDPRNRSHPGDFNYGGGHVIEELVAGKDIRLSATAYGTDCYPRKKLETWINLKDLNEAVLFNMRNAYQNYNVAVNSTDKTIYTYMGVLKPRFGSCGYSCAGQLSPLLKDPYYKTIGIGTRIFLGGGTGYVAWQGTQHNPTVTRSPNGATKSGAGTLCVIGDLKQMSQRYLVGTSMLGYGCTLTVGIGVPIPILNEEILKYTTITDAEIYAPVIDYGTVYPNRLPDILGQVTYAELRSGKINLSGKSIPTASLSSYPKALEIATILKDWISAGKFFLTEAVAPIPGSDSGTVFHPLVERPIEE